MAPSTTADEGPAPLWITTFTLDPVHAVRFDDGPDALLSPRSSNPQQPNCPSDLQIEDNGSAGTHLYTCSSDTPNERSYVAALGGKSPTLKHCVEAVGTTKDTTSVPGSSVEAVGYQFCVKTIRGNWVAVRVVDAKFAWTDKKLEFDHLVLEVRYWASA